MELAAHNTQANDWASQFSRYQSPNIFWRLQKSLGVIYMNTLLILAFKSVNDILSSPAYLGIS